MAKLLVVEKFALREFLRLHLETAGHSVVTAEDAGAAERVALAGAVQLIVAGGGNESLPGLERLRAVAPVPLILIGTRDDADARKYLLTATCLVP